jgi:hypothetical protein
MIMPRHPLSIVHDDAPGGDDRECSVREQVLIDRLKAFPTASAKGSVPVDQQMVEVASVLLRSQVELADALGWEICYSPPLRLLLLVYVRDAQGRDTSVESLCDCPILAAGTVALRWAAKLLDDGIVELVEGPEPGRPRICVTSDGVRAIERWLRFIKFELNRGSATPFSV